MHRDSGLSVIQQSSAISILGCLYPGYLELRLSLNPDISNPGYLRTPAISSPGYGSNLSLSWIPVISKWDSFPLNEIAKLFAIGYLELPLRYLVKSFCFLSGVFCKWYLQSIRFTPIFRNTVSWTQPSWKVRRRINWAKFLKFIVTLNLKGNIF